MQLHTPPETKLLLKRAHEVATPIAEFARRPAGGWRPLLMYARAIAPTIQWEKSLFGDRLTHMGLHPRHKQLFTPPESLGPVHVHSQSTNWTEIIHLLMLLRGERWGIESRQFHRRAGPQHFRNKHWVWPQSDPSIPWEKMHTSLMHQQCMDFTNTIPENG